MENSSNYRVKKIHIKDKKTIERCKELAEFSRHLYNKGNYILRQVRSGKIENIPEYQDLIKDNFISEFSLRKRMIKLNDEDFRKLNSYTSGYVLKHLFESWKSYFKLIKKYKSENIIKKVGFPEYAKGKRENVSYITFKFGQDINDKDGKWYFPKKTELPPIVNTIKRNNKEDKKIIDGELKIINLVMTNGQFYYHLVYEKNIKENVELDYNKYIGIDIGINNIMSVSDNTGESFIVNGRKIKSINQFCNKQLAMAHSYVGDKGTSNRIKAILHKRNNRFNNILHEMSNVIIKYCIEHKIGTIVIGKNKDWKQECKLNKKIKQHFVQIPHARLIEFIKYKAKQYNINVIEQQESYTSKCDALAKEEIKHHEHYLGKRVKRGLFKSSIGIKINADINASLNIMRKVVGDDFIDNLNKEKFLAPYKIY